MSVALKAALLADLSVPFRAAHLVVERVDHLA